MTADRRKRKPHLARAKGETSPETERQQTDDAAARASGSPVTQRLDDFIDGHRPLRGEEWDALPSDVQLQIGEMRAGIYRRPRDGERDLTEGAFRTRPMRWAWDD